MPSFHNQRSRAADHEGGGSGRTCTGPRPGRSVSTHRTCSGRAGAWRPAADCGARGVPSAGGSGGVTLIELLIVVAILAILAAVAVPKLVGSSTESRTAALEQNLAIMNKAIELYRLEHGGRLPGQLGAERSWKLFVDQMTLRTDRAGHAAPDTGAYGPYLRTGIPVHPFTGTASGQIKSVGPLSSDTAWYYDLGTGVIHDARDGTPGPEKKKADPIPID